MCTSKHFQSKDFRNDNTATVVDDTILYCVGVFDVPVWCRIAIGTTSSVSDHPERITVFNDWILSSLFVKSLIWLRRELRREVS